mmetsp:Transcript_6001/g.15623  ORF Transcript_6001/g.15623 Transcript_6001/m.15623 type:complete len:303 (-) Transcript_6001:305-1213(-)|eukprot:CAMPEP_0197421796 /NCGR_PEP_ID=MMETSP1170-20131217/11361_1 /TAXON_ID=54406 /ORGANISM="Sarcinochrysis sp, Strain CCMP770" /LENGTH=302 /DNA_ID=CAMNT_0042949077 /DNA_START=92 /DNA_END=1000 /DNA_ORIENTATION=+
MSVEWCPRPEVSVIVCRGAASPRRVGRECREIRKSLGGDDDDGPAIVECEAKDLATTLDGLTTKKIWVHLVGHACGTKPPGHEEVLRLEPARRGLAVQRNFASNLPMTSEAMIALLRSHPAVDLVFFNASRTKSLADEMRGIYAFGWATACLEEAAVAFAAAFYGALARDDDKPRAFKAAYDALSTAKAIFQVPNNHAAKASRKVVASVALADPETWITSRKRKRDETPLTVGLVPGIGRSKLLQLKDRGVKSLEALASLSDDDVAASGSADDVPSASQRATFARWRRAAQATLAGIHHDAD